MDPVQLQRATLGYRACPVLNDVSFAIRRGEFVGLLGPNGAGKTTLFRTVLGLLPPLGGTVQVLGTPARRGNPKVGYMPQARTGLPGAGLSGHAFVASAASGNRWGLPLLTRPDRREVERALHLVDATSLARLPLRDLSGGQRQRLLLAQALLGRPELLLLDEPLISLDPRRQQEVVALARHLCDELGVAILFSAHELNPLLGAMDRVLYVGGGHAAIGRVDQVVTAPVLSRLYGTEIEVVRAGGRIFVLAGGQDADPADHRHDQGHAHGHGHGHDHGQESPTHVRL